MLLLILMAQERTTAPPPISKGQLFYKYGFEDNCGAPPPATPFSYAAA